MCLYVRLLGATGPLWWALFRRLPHPWKRRLARVTINRVYALVWERGEVETLRPLLDADYELHVRPGGFFGLEGTYHGFEGQVGYYQRLREASEWDHFQIEDLRVLDEKFVALGTIWFKARHTGMEFDAPWAYVFVMRRGRLLRIESWSNQEAALQSVAST